MKNAIRVLVAVTMLLGGSALADNIELTYSTYLGGANYDYGYAIAVDAAGALYVAGNTGSSDFPVTNSYQSSMSTSYDVCISKFSATGATLLYSTYLGGSGSSDYAYGLAVDSNGCVFVTGNSNSSDFPTTNAFQATYGGGAADVFLAKLSADGETLLFSTYFGGSSDEYGYGIALNTSGGPFITGYTQSTNFPVTNAYQAARAAAADCFLAKFSADGAPLFSTYFGGNNSEEFRGVTVDSAGCPYLTGYSNSTNIPTTNAYQATPAGSYDMIISKFTADGSALIYSTYLGGNSTDRGYSISVDAQSNAYVSGETYSTNFPTTNAYQTASAGGVDAFAAKLGPGGTNLLFSTYLGGDGTDRSYAIALDDSGSAYVAGETQSTSGALLFPTTNAYQSTSQGGQSDGFVTRFGTGGSNLIYSTYLGGSGDDYCRGIALNNALEACVVGYTSSSDFPTTNAWQAATGGSSDIFISKLGSSLPNMLVLGTNGAVITSGDAATVTNGTDFGIIGQAEAVTNTFSITNNGTAQLAITSWTTNGSGAASFLIAGMPSAVAVGAVSNFNITFDPTGSGIFTSTLAIVNSSTTTPYQINLRGTATTPGSIGIAPTSLSYAATYNGADPATQTFTITNTGGTAYSYTNQVSYGAGASGWFTPAPATGSLATNGSQATTGTVSIAGINAGTYYATNAVTSPTATNSPQLLAVTLTVNKAAGDVYLQGLSQTYDGTARSVTATTDPSGLTVEFTYDGNAWAPTNAGSYAVTGTINDANYQGSVSGTLNVAQKGLTVTGATGDNKVYDATTDATITGGALIGVEAGDTVTLENASTGTFATATAGTNIAVTSYMTLGGADAGNYSLAQPTLSADITAKGLTVTGASGDNKVYDGNTDATITGGSLVGVEPGDTVTLGNASTGTFATATVGTNIAVTSYMTLGGADAGNYSLSQPTLDADITAKGLTVTGASGDNKAYDATTDATITGGSLVGVEPGDTVTLETASTGTFAQATIGTNIAVTSYMTLGGADAGNYSLSQPALDADITAKGLTVTGAAGDNKVYDSTTDATITGGSLVGVESGDTVTLENASTGTFATATVGTNIAVTSYMTLGGADAGNYSLSQPTLSADITKADQTINFPAIADQLETNEVGLAATATSGLAVTFAVGAGPASIAGGTNLTFTGPGSVSIVASQTGDANWNAAPDATNTFRVYGLYTLTIASAHGVPVQPAGIYTNVEDTVLTNTVSSPDTQSTTQYVCAGWSMTGSEPGSGVTTSCVMTVTNDAILTWLWNTNYWLDTGFGPHGTVDVVDSWQPAGVVTIVTATADSYYHFTNWSGDVSGPAVSSNPLSLLIDLPKAVTAHFDENLATNETPEWWLASHGWTSDFSQAAMADQDGDGLFTWEERIAGTIPTNSESVFVVVDSGLAYGTNYTEHVYTNTCPPATTNCGEVFTQRMYEVIGDIIDWPSVSGRLYSIEYCANLMDDPFVILDGATNIPATPDLNVYTNTANTNRQRIFYQIIVDLE